MPVMPLKMQIAESLTALNQRNFPAFMGFVGEDAALDMPDGSRVIGAQSLRDTLAAFVMRHDIRFVDAVIMGDDTGSRGAADVTVKAQQEPVDGGDGPSGGAVSLPGVIVFERDDALFLRISLYLSTAL
ncbi:MAG: nuclear transport factor 2 family protein [Rhizobium sp.]